MCKALRNVVLFLILVISLSQSLLPTQAQEQTRVEQGVAFLEKNHIPPEAYAELSAVLDSGPRLITEVLVKYGYTPEQIDAFMTEPNLYLLRSAINPEPSDPIMIQAVTILASYNLTLADLETLLPIADNPAALTNALMEKGLTQTQVEKLSQELASVIEEAETSIWIQYGALNSELETHFNQAGISTNMLFDSAHLLNDPQAAADYLAEIGYTEQEIQTFVELMPTLREQGITIGVVEGWNIWTMIYRLEGIGLSPQRINEILVHNNPDSLRDFLVSQGLSANVLELALVHIGGTMGYTGQSLNTERLEAFQVREAVTVLNSIGLDPAALSEILPLRDDPEALSAYIASNYERDAGEITIFIERLGQSTFARTVDPAHVEDFVIKVVAFAESSGG